ncbi:MAG: DegT/DnrJ/EryC1/StrS family aminotransferase [Candidatus Nitrotoga sp.]
MTNATQHPTRITWHPPAWPVYDAETIARVTSLVASNRVFDYGRGAEIAEIEEGFSRRYDGFHALTFNSGTSALYAAYRGLGFSNGAEVVVPTFTFQSTASPLLALGATPVLCDVGGKDGNVTAATIERQITTRTVGVVVTHLFGAPCEMEQIAALCNRRGLALVEDCSHAHASLYQGKPVGMHGDAAVFSLGARKMVSGGHGGILITRRSDVFDLACLVGHFKQRARTSVIDPRLRLLEDFALGGNLRMSPLAAVLAQGHVAKLSGLAREKRRLAHRLLAAAEATLGVQRLTTIEGGENGSYYDIVVALPTGATRIDRDVMVARLRERGLQVRSPATGLIHRSALMRADAETLTLLKAPTSNLDAMRRAVRHGRFEQAEDLHDRLISFPSEYIYGSMDRIVDEYIEAMASATGGARFDG